MNFIKSFGHYQLPRFNVRENFIKIRIRCSFFWEEHGILHIVIHLKGLLDDSDAEAIIDRFAQSPC